LVQPAPSGPKASGLIGSVVGADRERFNPERAAQLRNHLSVAQDQGSVTEVDHPQQQRSHRG
jgi:hypothetical protein